jgi:hypothetical protein
VHSLFHGEPEDSHSRGAGTRKKLRIAHLRWRDRRVEVRSGFRDKKDERKPIVLVIGELKPPVEKWENEGFLLPSF